MKALAIPVLGLALGLASCATHVRKRLDAPPAPESDATTVARTCIEASDAPAPIGPYSQGLCVGASVYCAGQIGLDPATGALVPGGIVAETARAFANVDAVLAAAGATRDDVVSITVFLADLAEFAAFNTEYARHVGSPPPARTTVQVARLPKDARVELQVLAVRRAR